MSNYVRVLEVRPGYEEEYKSVMMNYGRNERDAK